MRCEDAAGRAGSPPHEPGCLLSPSLSPASGGEGVRKDRRGGSWDQCANSSGNSLPAVGLWQMKQHHTSAVRRAVDCPPYLCRPSHRGPICVRVLIQLTVVAYCPSGTRRRLRRFIGRQPGASGCTVSVTLPGLAISKVPVRLVRLKVV
jgi:hypothetical protein